MSHSYDGCTKRNSLLVMHVTNDPNGVYARQVVNYLLSGAWPDVLSSSVSQSAFTRIAHTHTDTHTLTRTLTHTHKLHAETKTHKATNKTHTA